MGASGCSRKKEDMRKERFVSSDGPLEWSSRTRPDGLFAGTPPLWGDRLILSKGVSSLRDECCLLSVLFDVDGRGRPVPLRRRVA